ncbi:ATP-dependent zinc metalloprotease FtsH [Aquimarina celericrescens]|uniref:ATP-dependent zinc metalloprotease FtsH n=1 Tax=Aquimarina celericrescens TaxID=1964542 RepID=A0ABW5ARP7_9FLAO|nr:ATP-dependent zinc metalloprotease FtsH [Aquimarina celericrescens]
MSTEQDKDRINKSSRANRPQKPYKVFRINWLYVVMLFIILFSIVSRSSYITKEIGWSEFEQTMLSQLDVDKIVVVNKEVAEIYIKQERLNDPKYKKISEGLFKSKIGPHYKLSIGSVESFENKLEKAQQDFAKKDIIDVRYQKRTNWLNILSWFLPVGLIILFWFVLLRRSTTGSGGLGGSIFNFGKSTAKLMDKDKKSTVTFDDIAGLKEAKIEIKEIVDFLKNPETYTKLGAKIPKGVMLVGPPGTGKTLMAKAVAGEAKVPFFSLSGSEFVEMFVGVGASRVRDLFKQAKEKAPSIIFIDEIDAIGRSRGKANAFQTNDERENTLNQLLTELDGFGTNTGVIVLAATNRADILDKALLRPGRFDRHIYLELPNKQERKEIFDVHLRPIKKAEDVDIELLASLSPGFSGADIANICNEAALIAARKKKEIVEQDDFMEARDRVVGGLERKSKIISPKEKQIVAYHEAGHAVVSWYLKNVDSLVKVSIIPRGKSLGAAWYLPEEHQIITKAQFMDQICAALGGRAAEEIIFNEISSGALDDLEKVTKQAYNMVAYYGLDEEVGPISFYDSTGQTERLFGKPYSENMAKLIDKEVQDLILTAYKVTKKLLIDHKQELEKLAQLLLKKEVVYKEGLEKILGKRNPEISTEA